MSFHMWLAVISHLFLLVVIFKVLLNIHGELCYQSRILLGQEKPLPTGPIPIVD